jgi:hypothetical protein
MSQGCLYSFKARVGGFPDTFTFRGTQSLVVSSVVRSGRTLNLLLTWQLLLLAALGDLEEWLLFKLLPLIVAVAARYA